MTMVEVSDSFFIFSAAYMMQVAVLRRMGSFSMCSDGSSGICSWVRCSYSLPVIMKMRSSVKICRILS